MYATTGAFLFTSFHAILCVSMTGTTDFTAEAKSSISDESQIPKKKSCYVEFCTSLFSSICSSTVFAKYF